MLDSSAWLEYLNGTERGNKIKEIVEERSTASSILAIAELADKFERDNLSFEKQLSFIQSRSAILPLTFDLCLAAARIKKQFRKKADKFSLADGVHFATAILEECTLITADNDFNGEKNVLLI